MMGNDGKDMEHPADLDLSSSSSFPFPTITSSGTPCSSYMYNHQHSLNPRKKRTKLVKINQPNSLLGNNKPPKRHRKPDPLAPKITRPCTECGKKFWSWKALFGHMRCHPERQWRGINPPPNHRREPPPPTPIAAATTTATTSSPSIPHQKEHYFLGAAEQVNDMSEEEHEVAACLLMLANSDHNGEGGGSSQIHYDQEATCRFECSSCKKVFGSHQALGGHRASHKNVKGCFAITRTSCDGCQIPAAAAADHVVKENLEEEDYNMMVVLGHRCDICSRVFPSGQALGGHKRCHWERAEEASSSMLNNEFRGPGSLLSKQAAAGACGCGLDLNLPAPIEHEYPTSSTLTLDLTLGL